jgi:hypothetical protein
MGPGVCDPNPCPVSTTTTRPEPGIPACSRAVTLSSVACRLEELIGMVDAAGEMHGLRGTLLAPLHRTAALLQRAARFRAAGRTRRWRAAMRRATRDLAIVRHHLRGRAAQRSLPPGVRAVMIDLAEPLRIDLVAVVAAAGR